MISVKQKHATELSFTLREQERNVAELITYDDMESVTKQLEEEYEKSIEVSVLWYSVYCLLTV